MGKPVHMQQGVQTTMDSIVVIGSGAMGGLIGGRLALHGHEVTFIDRGDHLAALKRRGLRLIDVEGRQHRIRNARYTDWTDMPGTPELIVLATKAHEIPAVAHRVAELSGPDTTVVTVQNGLPWWYFHGLDGGETERTLRSLDPEGITCRCIPATRIVGAVAYPAAEVVRPGVVKHVEGDRFALGELDGAMTERLRGIGALLDGCGLRTRLLSDIRSEIWLKAWGTMGLNPVTALTGKTMGAVCRDRETRELLIGMMREGELVAKALGITLRVSLERRLAGAERVGEHKSSMLQDLEAGRPMEIDALVGSILELGRRHAVPMPLTGAVYALLKARNSTLLCGHPAGISPPARTGS
jgi:2-dehydropantoate 2-reductase